MYVIFKLVIKHYIMSKRTFIIFLSYFVLYSSIYSKCCQGSCCKPNSISQEKPNKSNQIGKKKR